MWWVYGFEVGRGYGVGGVKFRLRGYRGREFVCSKSESGEMGCR